MKCCIPDTIQAQVIAIMLAALLATSVIFAMLVTVTRPMITGSAVCSLLILTIALPAWILWRINRSLRILATTAERSSASAELCLLPETGHTELRRVARALNRMQEQTALAREERRRMLMAIGHDLRTPLTRLRLRVELDQAFAARPGVIRDVELMEKLINSALRFLKDETEEEPFQIVDLGELVESTCAVFTTIGTDVTYLGYFGIECRCQPTAITRAITNLIDNGCRYGTRVVADTWRENGCAIIEIRDDGCGIPPEKREIALLPFIRLDSERQVNGSLGLGLSIVNDVVGRHCGRLSLLDAHPSGLLVRIELPVEDIKPTSILEVTDIAG